MTKHMKRFSWNQINGHIQAYLVDSVSAMCHKFNNIKQLVYVITKANVWLLTSGKLKLQMSFHGTGTVQQQGLSVVQK